MLGAVGGEDFLDGGLRWPYGRCEPAQQQQQPWLLAPLCAVDFLRQCVDLQVLDPEVNAVVYVGAPLLVLRRLLVVQHYLAMLLKQRAESSFLIVILVLLGVFLAQLLLHLPAPRSPPPLLLGLGEGECIAEGGEDELGHKDLEARERTRELRQIHF